MSARSSREGPHHSLVFKVHCMRLADNGVYHHSEYNNGGGERYLHDAKRLSGKQEEGGPSERSRWSHRSPPI